MWRFTVAAMNTEWDSVVFNIYSRSFLFFVHFHQKRIEKCTKINYNIYIWTICECMAVCMCVIDFFYFYKNCSKSTVQSEYIHICLHIQAFGYIIIYTATDQRILIHRHKSQHTNTMQWNNAWLLMKVRERLIRCMSDIWSVRPE